MKKKVYLVFSQTNTILSKIIKFITKNEYSHVSISFDKECKTMYSFGRKYDINPFYGIFKIENISKGLFKKSNAKIAIYELEVKEKVYENIKTNIKKIEQENEGYNILGLLLAIFGFRIKRKKYYCSEFVYQVLSDNNVNLIKKTNKCIRPIYIYDNISDLKLIYSGRVNNYISKKENVY